MTELCNRLKNERKRTGLNQEEFGEVGGVKAGAQLNYENGSRTPDATYLNNLRKIGVDVWYVLTGEHLTSQLSGEESELLSGYRQLDTRGKARVLGVIDGLGIEPSIAAQEKKQAQLGHPQKVKKSFFIQDGRESTNISTDKTTIKVGRKKKDAL
ncbi:hypothetical protein BCF11_3283 [Collimonas sp. PA-H2]|uniref:helix-turn-helix domain-containing protein n=1 Tax=Collimonas sp. PA-H2 TaxID=1881062 RepID=UPI000BFA923E|nr:helix-turn-helix transcriptional regulator [Collimonas sp. PA-H2]PFH10849.1 hypothetical protein BCF11_3283 [Collimonas sp. PA-H2]